MSSIHYAARQELEVAAVYYSEISLDLAEKFLKDYEQTLYLSKLCQWLGLITLN
jgi:hypothetical protein